MRHLQHDARHLAGGIAMARARGGLAHLLQPRPVEYGLRPVDDILRGQLRVGDDFATTLRDHRAGVEFLLAVAVREGDVQRRQADRGTSATVIAPERPRESAAA